MVPDGEIQINLAFGNVLSRQIGQRAARGNNDRLRPATRRVEIGRVLPVPRPRPPEVHEVLQFERDHLIAPGPVEQQVPRGEPRCLDAGKQRLVSSRCRLEYRDPICVQPRSGHVDAGEGREVRSVTAPPSSALSRLSTHRASYVFFLTASPETLNRPESHDPAKTMRPSGSQTAPGPPLASHKLQASPPGGI